MTKEGSPFADLLRSHLMMGTRPGRPMGRRWSNKEFAHATGVIERTVRNWITGRSTPPELATIERELFGNDLALHSAEVEALRRAYDDARLRRPSANKPGPVSASASQTVEIVSHSDAVGHLGAYELDHLPISAALTIHSVSYGEGARILSIPGEALRWLPLDTAQITQAGEYGGPSRFLPQDPGELGTAEETASLLLPRNFRVSVSCAEADWGVQLYVCTDMPYGNFPNYPRNWPFTLNGVLGQGGVAAFVDRWGKLHPRNAVGLGGELGCAALVTVVAFHGREAVCRTPYFVVVRKGIRYPDDRWQSRETGGPILSPSDSIADARFVFQSWETAGQSKDLFVADFNGLRMCNLNEADETALETFEDDGGREVIRWVDKDHIQFCTNARGNGFGEIVVRRDCAAL